MIAPWLLQPGDPLPGLPLADGLWTPAPFSGFWAIVVVSARPETLAPPDQIRLLGIASPQTRTSAPPGWHADSGTLCAQRLGALVGADTVATVAVLLDPAGTVVASAAAEDINALIADLAAQVPAKARGQLNPSSSR